MTAQIKELKDLHWTRPLKNLVQHHINFAKAKATPRQRDLVAIHLLKQMIKKLESNSLKQKECQELDMYWHRYIEYAGEHEIHDCWSLELNIYAVLITGLYDKELFFQIRRVARQAEKLGWYNPLDYYRTLLYGEPDARVFVAQRLEADEAVAYTMNRKVDQELMEKM